jgi:hypothetical protein
METYGHRYATNPNDVTPLGEEECNRVIALLVEKWNMHKGMKTVFGVDPRLEVSACMSEDLVAEMPKALETLTEDEQHRVKVLVGLLGHVWVRIVIGLMDEGKE